MALADLTEPTAVLQAIREADSLGRDRFLEKYGFGRSREYFLEHQGKRYDSKAIAGVAYGFQHPAEGPLTAGDFSGGEQTVQRRLEALGFRVIVARHGGGPALATHSATGETVCSYTISVTSPRRLVVPVDKAAKPGRAIPPCGPIGDDPTNWLPG